MSYYNLPRIIDVIDANVNEFLQIPPVISWLIKPIYVIFIPNLAILWENHIVYIYIILIKCSICSKVWDHSRVPLIANLRGF